MCTQAIAGDIQSIQPQLQPVLYPGHCWDSPSYNLLYPGHYWDSHRYNLLYPGHYWDSPSYNLLYPGPLLGQPQVQPVLYPGHCWGSIAQPQLQPVLYPGHCWDSPRYDLCCTQAIAGTAPGTISVVPRSLLETFSTAQATSSTQQLMRHPELRSCVKVEMDVLGSRP